MSNSTRTFEDVRRCMQSGKSSTGRDGVKFYNIWAETYLKDVDIIAYNAPTLAVNFLSSNYHGDRERALVLDVACGTGLVGLLMNKLGFRHFVGIDGSKAMMEHASKTGLYQDLTLCLLGTEPMPAQAGFFDVVMIVGGLGVGLVPVSVVRELCQATKPGGYICMMRALHRTEEEYTGALESELGRMEEEGLWGRIEVKEVEEYMRDMSQQDVAYIGGRLYLYRRSFK